jgi:hypothetical protein
MTEAANNNAYSMPLMMEQPKQAAPMPDNNNVNNQASAPVMISASAAMYQPQQNQPYYNQAPPPAYDPNQPQQPQYQQQQPLMQGQQPMMMPPDQGGIQQAQPVIMAQPVDGQPAVYASVSVPQHMLIQPIQGSEAYRGDEAQRGINTNVDVVGQGKAAGCTFEVTSYGVKSEDPQLDNQFKILEFLQCHLSNPGVRVDVWGVTLYTYK